MGLARTLLFFASFVALFRHLAAEYNTCNTSDMGFKDVLCLALISTAVLLLCSRPLYDGLCSDLARLASRQRRQGREPAHAAARGRAGGSRPPKEHLRVPQSGASIWLLREGARQDGRARGNELQG